MKRLLGIFIFLLISAAAFAQQQDKPLVQFSGVVYNADSTSVIVPYVTVTNKSSHNQVFATNYKGYFSFVAHEQDTIRFTSVGYAPQIVVIPQSAKEKSFVTKVYLKPQVINLPTFRVFPWATTDEFKKDFLTLKVADDDLETARKNLARTTSIAARSALARDAQEISSYNLNEMHNTILNSHSLVPNPLLNPIAWGTLIKDISSGDKSRSQ
jgi:hypothetical protein